MTDKERRKVGCGKTIKGEYEDGGIWKMRCGDLNRLCPECQAKLKNL